ncbi:bifunctional diaminohydroxyphosphoribosylaminopyrimidine deaminase/5-amino-6-(5-phosphoribosylamino)uracil reductase RibD [Propionicimonas sp.]|uniref:bifunctional diaminohydroxyphosphoribosylaminopyrimidine deaminase/5-amino-6-(5-phosphoribosylamino)uracil reductase RibD n=1 Tax=Propionicimonas sp. TaxID=1955623 RepID=UPI0025E96739|nr:bifunctional diaminohydroxyphosphoribosylaminopyrimidine deaminase/5-amino-6-(5-phosphoribosylamino)uracil reductase RibD [Propionicimonas sp.]MCG2804890.1 bifunctional diaminohydroxyphosphoribosylaminopyrimidine deaminase/5-amino-6-(5-phosphoribosylamino)uracil reductase RibD [Propionicimonas sp.]
MSRTQNQNDHGRVSAAELQAMGRAFELARRGPQGSNPQVGAVLLAPDGQPLAEGWHQGAGTAHAEVVALAAAQADGRNALGATAVVSLEPCNHTGRTGPCSQALVKAGVRRVVYAVADPNPSAAGGAEQLRQAGIEVVGDVLAAQGRQLLQAWLAGFQPVRPYVILKIAQSLDARVAAADGTSRWITGAAARVHAHGIRAEVDAIVVGIGTVLADNPALTARTADGALAARQPERIVVGRREVPASAAVRGTGGALMRLPTHDPAEVLDRLAARGHRQVLVEGGPTLASAFLQAGVVDELHCYLAPLLLGAGTSAVSNLGIATLAQAQRWQISSTHLLDPDLLLIANPLKEKSCLPE